MKRAVADWYQTKTPEALIYQAIKYQSRDGWSHRDLLRLTHPKADSLEINAIYKWIVDGEYPIESDDQLTAMIRLHATEAAIASMPGASGAAGIAPERAGSGTGWPRRSCGDRSRSQRR